MLRKSSNHWLIWLVLKEHQLCLRIICSLHLYRFQLIFSFIIRVLDERKLGHIRLIWYRPMRDQLLRRRIKMILLTKLNKIYAAFWSCKSENSISKFSYTFVSHHTNVILVEFEICSSLIYSKMYLQILTSSVALFT